MKSLFFAAFSLVIVCHQPLGAGVDIRFPYARFGWDHLRRITVSPYESRPYARDKGLFELCGETEVNPYLTVEKPPDWIPFRGLLRFRSPTSLSPPEWGSRFGKLRQLEDRELWLMKFYEERDATFSQGAAWTSSTF